MAFVAHNSGAVVKLHSSAGRVVAVARAGTLERRIAGSRHMLRRPPSIAFDAVVLAEAELLHVNRLEVTDTDDGGRLYWCTLAEFRQHAFELDRGFGRQFALPLERWHTAGDGLQLTLWGTHG